MTDLNPPLLPRDGPVLRIIAVCRISTPHQDKRSLDDQLAKLKQFVADHYDGPVEWTLIASQGSGEQLDRKELYQLEELIEGDRHDVVGAEDLGRVCRRRRACDLCELCVDHNVRLIAINDRVDTVEDGCEDSAFISTWHHERSNRDTSEGIKRSLRHRFVQGGVCDISLWVH
jgi:site-specific DNA recombinase